MGGSSEDQPFALRLFYRSSAKKRETKLAFFILKFEYRLTASLQRL